MAQIGIQSIELAAPILRAMANAAEPLPLKDLATAAGMPRGQAHKYLTSLVRCGLAAQAAPSEPYGLGPLSLALGLAAIRDLDVVELAQGALNELRDRLNTSAALAIWGSHGPTIVRRAIASDMMSPSIRLGTVFPVTTSLVGLVFAAFLDKQYTEKMITAELAQPDGAARRAGLHTLDDVDKLLQTVRKDHCIGGPTIADGVVAIAAPIFDQTSSIAAVIAVAGLSGRFDVSLGGKSAQTLLDVTEEFSQRLGGVLTKESLG